MIKKTIYLLAAVTVGGIFAWLKVPAGWLLGSILAGIICSFFIMKLYLPNKLFNVVLAIIGGNIGLMLRPEQFLNYQALILRLIRSKIFLISISFPLPCSIYSPTLFYSVLYKVHSNQKKKPYYSKNQNLRTINILKKQVYVTIYLLITF